MTRIFDFYAASVTPGTKAVLANRLDTNLTFLSSRDGLKLTLRGVVVKSANTGYLELTLDSEPVATLCVKAASALSCPIELDIPIPIGSRLTVSHLSSIGSSDCSAILICDAE